ncbi:hypothetical protein TNCV_4965101 [Trichonephila clavipes]|nr:hypothetical protein TNCV_4965101 [Trichonephila clavipes]
MSVDFHDAENQQRRPSCMLMRRVKNPSSACMAYLLTYSRELSSPKGFRAASDPPKNSTVSRDFNFVTDVLYEKLKLQDVFTSKDQVIRYMPPPFRMYCKNVRIIVDCTKIEVQKPSSPME